MLGLAKRLNAKILQASTSEVYGDPKYIRNLKLIGEIQIQLDHVLVMMKEKDVRSHYL